MQNMIQRDDIEMKTEFPNPPAVAKAEVYGLLLSQEGCSDSEELWNAYLNGFKINMVSYKGKRAEAIFSALKAMVQDERDKKSRLLGKKE